MTSPKSYKHRITELVIKNLPKEYRFDLGNDTEKILPKLWTTGRQDGLRLTSEGERYFQLANLEFHDISLEQDMKLHKNNDWNKFLLDCSKKIKCPYFFGVKKDEGNKRIGFVRLYESKIAMLIKIYGSMQDYLNSIKETK